VAPGTVARTYRELEAAGVLRSRRGAGTVVTTRSPVRPGRARRELVEQLLGEAVVRARAVGDGADEVRPAVGRALSRPTADR